MPAAVLDTSVTRTNRVPATGRLATRVAVLEGLGLLRAISRVGIGNPLSIGIDRGILEEVAGDRSSVGVETGHHREEITGLGGSLGLLGLLGLLDLLEILKILELLVGGHGCFESTKGSKELIILLEAKKKKSFF